jgi:hypothetical protein
MPRLKTADWTHFEHISPELEQLATENRTLIGNLTDNDMELSLEYDMLRLADHEKIQAHLKDSARLVWTKAASVPNCRPLATKISIIPQNKDTKLETDTFEIRYPKLFDLGFKIPEPEYHDRTDHVLAEKKLAFGLILKSNEETKKIEQEIANADPTKKFDISNYIDPTMASVFAEHELLAFFQLRFIKIREYRIKVLRQLNFYRSIERRLVLEVNNFSTVDKTDPIINHLAEMYIKLTQECEI